VCGARPPLDANLFDRVTTMSQKILGLAALALVAAVACTNEPAAPVLQETETIDLLPDYAFSAAAEIDGAGIGAARLPDELRLTADQKAEIAALHQAFAQANASQLAALRDIERQMRELRRNNGSRDEFRQLMAQAKTILDSLAAKFAALQQAIWAVYTPEQRAWIEAHRPKVCGPGGPPQLTEAQVAQIRALREAFHASVADEMAAIKAAHEAARAAHQSGATREQIQAILEGVKDEMEVVRAAERKLAADIQAVLTPEQRAAWCVVRKHVAPRHP
jgi:Spy/CpxP family protein refolding chaperone